MFVVSNAISVVLFSKAHLRRQSYLYYSSTWVPQQSQAPDSQSEVDVNRMKVCSPHTPCDLILIKIRCWSGLEQTKEGGSVCKLENRPGLLLDWFGRVAFSFNVVPPAQDLYLQWTLKWPLSWILDTRWGGWGFKYHNGSVYLSQTLYAHLFFHIVHVTEMFCLSPLPSCLFRQRRTSFIAR